MMKPFYNFKVKELEMKKNLKTTGFRTPEKYFDDFEAELFARISQENFPNSSGFQVPSNYFDNLEAKVLAQEISLKKQAKVISLYPKRYIAYAAAIAASLIIGIVLFNWKQNNSTIDTVQLGLIDKYIDDGNLNMDLYDLTTYLESRDFPIMDIENHYLTDTALENYLLENTDEEQFYDH